MRRSSIGGGTDRRGLRTAGTPSQQTLARYRERGLSVKQMQDEWEAESGYRVKSGTLYAALSRGGLVEPKKGKHKRAVPWTVERRYASAYHGQMLRALSALRQDLPVPEKRRKDVESWRRRMEDADLLVGYVAGRGFMTVKRGTVPPELRDDQYPIVLADEHGRPYSKSHLKSLEPH